MRIQSFVKEEILAKISLKLLANIEYRHSFGHFINWKNPNNINEKIQWLKPGEVLVSLFRTRIFGVNKIERF